MPGVGGILHSIGGPNWIDRVLLITVIVFLGAHVVTKRLENLEYVLARHTAIMTFRGVVRRNSKGEAKLYNPGFLKYVPGFNKLYQANMMLRMRSLSPLTRELQGGFWRIEIDIRYQVRDVERSLLTSENPDEQVVALCSSTLQKLDLTPIEIAQIPDQLPEILKAAAQDQVAALGFKLVDILVVNLEPTTAHQLGKSLLDVRGTVPLAALASTLNGHQVTEQ